MAQRDWFEKDFYKVLGVSDKASKDEIKRAYRKLARKHHPDTNKDDAEAEHRFKEVSEAYSILSNEEKRKEYDEIQSYSDGGSPFGFRPGRPGGGQRVNVNVEDLFGRGQGSDVSDLFGGLFGFRQSQRKGQDLESNVYLSFEDAVGGTMVELAGGPKVRIPAGVKDNARIRVSGKGGPGPHGGPPGDLYVRVHVAPHPVFRQGDKGDLLVTVPVTFPEAALGAKISVPTLGGSVTVKIPAGTRSGKVLRVKGRGGPFKGRGSLSPDGRSDVRVEGSEGKTGDLLVMIEVQVPSKLTKKEKELLEQFAALQKEDPRAHFAEFIRRSEAAS